MHCHVTPPPARNSRESGFTLVEISIVLVIIGLIVGGILVGQSLIITASERAEITQIEKYNQAVNTFYSKFGGLPGDLIYTTAAQFGFTGTGGYCIGQAGGRDGNGQIQGVAGGTVQSGEAMLFWSDLATASLVGDVLPNTTALASFCSAGYYGFPVLSLTPGATYIGNYLPAGKIGYGTFVQVYNNNGANWYSLNIVLSVDGSGNTNLAYGCGGICSSQVTGIPAAMAYDIDAKIDDGLPQTGNVTAYFDSRGSVRTSQGFTSVNSYLVTNGCTGGYCALSFKMQGGN